MNKLNDEFLLKILNNLDVATLIRCRSVSKRWKTTISKIKLTELVVQDDAFDFLITDKWFGTTNDRIHQSSVVKVNKRWSLNKMPFNLKKLKRLYMQCTLVDVTFDVKTLNKLVNLEHLIIYRFIGFNCVKLYFPKLNSFYCGVIPFATIVLTAPNLESLCVLNGIERFDLKKPNTVKHLMTRCTNRRLEVYRNLETLELVTPIDLNLEPILNLPAKLKVVRLDESDLIPILSYETSYRVMNHFIQQKKLHRKKKLKIYFLDTLLDENNKRFEDYDCVKNYKFTDLKEFVNDFINEMHSDSSKPTKQPDNHPITTIKTIGIVLIVLLYRYFN